MVSNCALANMLLIHNVCQYRMLKIQSGSYKVGLATEADCDAALETEFAIVESALTKMRNLAELDSVGVHG